MMSDAQPSKGGSIVARAKDTGIDLPLVIGAALFWGSAVCMGLFPAEFSGGGAAIFENGIDILIERWILFAFIAVGLLVPRVYLSDRGRQVIYLVILVTGVLLPFIPTGADTFPALRLFRMTLFAFDVGVLAVIWGFAFASLDKRTAARNVTLTAAITVLLVLGNLMLLRVLPNGILMPLYFAGSAVVLLRGGIRFVNHPRGQMPLRPFSGRRGRFFAVRAVYGFAIGALFVFSRWHLQSDASVSLALFSGALTIISLVVLLRSPRRTYAVLPSFALLALLAVYLPFSEFGLEALITKSGGLIWFALAMLSGVQLSVCKEDLEMSEISLCTMEKTVVMGGMAIGGVFSTVYQALGGVAAFESMDPIFDLIPLAFVCAAILVMLLLMNDVIFAREEEEAQERAAEAQLQQDSEVLDRIAVKHGLTGRECEVMSMLMDGYSYSHIASALVISNGTAKTHIAHIYQKLGVHRKDDFIAFVDAEMKKERVE